MALMSQPGIHPPGPPLFKNEEEGSFNFMGIDFSHCDAHWAYSGFHRFRTRLATQVGLMGFDSS